MTSRRVALFLSVVVALALAACGSGSSVSTGPSNAPAGPLTVKDAWVRAAPAGADTAAYFTIVNGKVNADTLVGASASVGKSAGLHQTTTDPSGMTGMKMTESVKVPGGGIVQFAPGGYHVMIIGLAAELKVGDTVDLQLSFENAGMVKVTAEVRTS